MGFFPLHLIFLKRHSVQAFEVLFFSREAFEGIGSALGCNGGIATLPVGGEVKPARSMLLGSCELCSCWLSRRDCWAESLRVERAEASDLERLWCSAGGLPELMMSGKSWHQERGANGYSYRATRCRCSLIAAPSAASGLISWNSLRIRSWWR